MGIIDLRGLTPDAILIKYTGFISGLLDINRRPSVFIILTKYTGFGPTPDVILTEYTGFISGLLDINRRLFVFVIYLSSPPDDLILLIISYNDIINNKKFGRPRFFLITIIEVISTASFLLISIGSVSIILLLLAGSFFIIFYL